MKEHKCDKKHLICSDNPQNDIWEAAVEKKEPKFYPTIGFTCACGEDFRIEMKKGNKMEVPKELGEFLKTAAGKQKLCEFFSKQ
jgi:hypothetical protein